MKNIIKRSRRLIAIAWLFVFIVIVTLSLAIYSFSLLSAGRAYVGGEGLWSKSQKEMVYMLARYVRYHEEVSFQAFQSSLEVIQGDSAARVELEKENPDYRIAKEGFIKGRNHPDDIDGMIHLFRTYRHVPELEKAIDIWTRADAEIAKLAQLSAKIHAEGQSGTLDQANSLLYLDQVFQINQNLRPMEDEFSYTLGDANRKLRTLLIFLMFAVVSVLVVLAYIFSRRVVRQNDYIQNLLQEGEKQLSDLMQFAPLSILIFRYSDEVVTYANDQALLQFKIDTVILYSVHVRILFVRHENLADMMSRITRCGSVSNNEIQFRDSHGVVFWTLLSARRIKYNMQDCVLMTLSHIDELKHLQDELQRRAFHDYLTGLPNRAMFMESLNTMIRKASKKTGSAFAILFIDLDRFKIINDELGHDVGDSLLQQVAQRLRSNIRQCDFVSRLGGDEFVVVLDESPDRTVIIFTAKAIIDAVADDYLIGSHRVNVTTSIGISRFPDDGTECSTLMKNADVAMYRAKERGRNDFQIYGELR